MRSSLTKYEPVSLKRRRSERRYLRRAIGHPLNVSLLVVLAVFALAYGVFAWLLCGVALEVFALSLLSRSAFFRVRAERRIAEAELASLRLQLDGSQLRELQKLEELVQAVRQTEDSVAVDDDALSRLIDGWVRLALVHKSGRELIASTDRRSLEDEVHALEAQLAANPPPALARLQRRRLELARRRLERLELAVEKVEIVAQQLSTIGEMIHYLHEQALTPSDSQLYADELAGELDRVLVDLGHHDEAIEELEVMAAEPA